MFRIDITQEKQILHDIGRTVARSWTFVCLVGAPQLGGDLHIMLV